MSLASKLRGGLAPALGARQAPRLMGALGLLEPWAAQGATVQWDGDGGLGVVVRGQGADFGQRCGELLVGHDEAREVFSAEGEQRAGCPLWLTLWWPSPDEEAEVAWLWRAPWQEEAAARARLDGALGALDEAWPGAHLRFEGARAGAEGLGRCAGWAVALTPEALDEAPARFDGWLEVCGLAPDARRRWVRRQLSGATPGRTLFLWGDVDGRRRLWPRTLAWSLAVPPGGPWPTANGGSPLSGVRLRAEGPAPFHALTLHPGRTA